MTLTSWRTTKIPDYYFEQIEQAIAFSPKYVSVSEFIRQAIEEKLSFAKKPQEFLLIKDIVFTEIRIKQIHEIICSQFKSDSSELLKENIRMIIDQSLDLDLITFLSKFMYNFAAYHPFKDANKRTALIAVDTFLRLNHQKLKLKAKKDAETEDELFFWKNSTQQKNQEQIKKFLEKHIDKHRSSENVEEEIKASIRENKVMLEKLAR